jgi:hypothetical protein
VSAHAADPLTNLKPSTPTWWAAFRAALMVIAGALMLLVLPIASGRPVIYSDTKSYYELGEQVGILAKIVKAPTDSSASNLGAPTGSTTPNSKTPTALPATNSTAKDPRLAFTVAGARPPSYSFYFYLVQHLGTAWGVVIVQALALSGTIFVLLNGIGRASAFLWVMPILALCSSLPIQTEFLMPDVFAGQAACALAYIVCARRPTRVALVVMAAALAFSLSSATSNIIIALPVALIGTLATWMLKLYPLSSLCRRSIALLVAFVLAISVSFIYGAAIKVLKHETLGTPPFLTARVIADGPGRNYLLKACADDGAYALCRYKSVPMTNSNDILWSHDPKTGVFQFADFDTRVAISKEQTKFVVSAVLSDPGGVLKAAWNNFWIELTSYRVDESYADPAVYFADPSFAIFGKILPGGTVCLRSPHACAPRLSLRLINGIMLAGTLISLIVLASLLWISFKRDRITALVAALMLVFFVMNAGVCGILSGTFQRYQTRVEWLLAFAAILVVAAVMRKPDDAKRHDQFHAGMGEGWAGWFRRGDHRLRVLMQRSAQ